MILRSYFILSPLVVVPLFDMSFSILACSETSTQRSTSFDDISSDGSNQDQTNHTPPAPVQDLWNQGRTYANQYPSAAEIQHQYLRDLRDHQPPPLLEPLRPIVPSRRCRMNMDVVVDLEALLPDGIQDLRTGQPVVNLDSVHIFTFTSYTQLQDLTVDYIKSAIQELSGNVLDSHFEKGTSNSGYRCFHHPFHFIHMAFLNLWTTITIRLKF